MSNNPLRRDYDKHSAPATWPTWAWMISGGIVVLFGGCAVSTMDAAIGVFIAALGAMLLFAGLIGMAVKR